MNNNYKSDQELGLAGKLLIERIDAKVEQIRKAYDSIEFTKGNEAYVAELIAKIAETNDLDEQMGYATEALTYLGQLLKEQ